MSRILFIKCQSRVGTRRATGKPLDGRIQANYSNLCHGMLAATSKGELTYDESGFGVYCSFFDEIEPQLTPDIGELSFMGDWAGKLPGNMTRLAGLIHCIAAFEKGANPLDTQINADEARAAVELARFYLAHARTVYGEQAETQSITDAKYLWRRVNSLNSLEITKSKLTRATQNYRKGEFNLDESLLELERRGYIRIDVSRKEGTDKPTTTILINQSTKQSEFSEITPTFQSKFTKFTHYIIPANIPSTKTAADFTGFTEIPADEPESQPPNNVIDLHNPEW